MEFAIVPLTETHIEGFREAVDAVARERKYLALLEIGSLEDTRKFLRALANGNRPGYVAIAGNRIIGWCDISSLNRPIYAHAGVLGMGVVDGYREIGVGAALMGAALARAREIGLTRVELTVRQHNVRAKKLYEKFGFVVEGIKRRGVFLDDCYEDLICMGLLLQ